MPKGIKGFIKGHKPSLETRKKFLSNRNARTHGRSNHPLYAQWRAMLNRCHNKNNRGYKWYGGRGIFVTESWHNIENFIADVSEGYQKGLELDRTDNDKGYSKENCRWVTRIDNMSNVRSNLVLEYKGKKFTLSSLSREKNLKIATVWARLKKGDSVEEAVRDVIH